MHAADWPTDLAETLARLILKRMVETSHDAKMLHESGFRFAGRVYEESPGSRPSSREENRHFLTAWVNVVNEYLEDHEFGPLDEIIRSVDETLQLYQDGDNWPVETTGQLLTRILRHQYVAPREEVNDEIGGELHDVTPLFLLTGIVHITGRIPDFVRNDQPRSLKTRNELKRFQLFLDRRQNWSDFNDELQPFLSSELLHRAPYETIKQVCNADSEVLRQMLGQNFLLHTVSPFGGPKPKQISDEVYYLRLDSLLTLAILEELAGESDKTDANLQSFFQPSVLENAFRSDIKELLNSQRKSRTFVQRLLNSLEAKSKNDELKSAARKWLSNAAVLPVGQNNLPEAIPQSPQ